MSGTAVSGGPPRPGEAGGRGDGPGGDGQGLGKRGGGGGLSGPSGPHDPHDPHGVADAAALPEGGAERDAPTLLALMWLASPALPVGAFSYSEGLEAAVEAGVVAGEDDAARWLLDQLDLALARADLPLMLHALDAWRRGDLVRVGELNDWVRRTRESSEALAQSEQTGRSLAGWLRHGGTGAHAARRSDGATAVAAGHGPAGPAASSMPAPVAAPDGRAAPHVADPRVDALAALEPAPTWPVAFALAAAQAGAAPRDAALAYAFGWAENMAQAAMKAVPLGQAAAQRLLGGLAAAMPDAVDAARRRAGVGADESGAPGDAAPARAEAGGDAGFGLQAYAPGWAILSSRHEVQYSRLFRS